MAWLKKMPKVDAKAADAKTARRKKVNVDPDCNSGFFLAKCADVYAKKMQEIGKAPPQGKTPPCMSQTLERRTIPSQPGSWRADTGASDRPLPHFFLHDSGGADFSGVTAELRERIGNGLAEEVLPVSFSQYLVDMPLVESLRTHPRRTRVAASAQWHILGAMPFASRLLSLLHANVTADGNHVCDTRGVCTSISLKHGGGRAHATHRLRMHKLLLYLKADAHWRRPNTPFLLFSTGININEELTIDIRQDFFRELLNRNAKVGPVILAGVDRSGPHSISTAIMPLLRRMIILPHVATPECTRHAARTAAPRSARVRKVGSSGSEGGSVVGVEAALSRHGFLFHGHNGRYDNGARAAVRDIATHLKATYDFQMLRLMVCRRPSSSSTY